MTEASTFSNTAPRFFEQEPDFLEENEAADAAPAFVRIRKMVTDIARTKGTEHGIGQGVDQHIGVGMAFKALVVRQFDASQEKFATCNERMNIITNAYAIHKNRLACLKIRQQQAGKRN